MLIDKTTIKVGFPDGLKHKLEVIGIVLVGGLYYINKYLDFPDALNNEVIGLAVCLFLLFVGYIFHYIRRKNDFIETSAEGLEVSLHTGILAQPVYGKYNWQTFKISVRNPEAKATLVVTDDKGSVVFQYLLNEAMPSTDVDYLISQIDLFTKYCTVDEDVEATSGNEGVGYKGKVKTVTAYYTNADWTNYETSGATFQKGPKQKVMFYNEDGLLTEAYYYMPNGFKCCTETCDFDENGHFIAKRVKIAGKDAYINLTRIYDVDGNKIEEKSFDPEDGSWVTEKLTYSNGVLSSTEMVGQDFKSTYTVNANGNVLTQETVHGKGMEDYDFRCQCEYDEKENLIKKTTYTLSGVEIEREVYSYDANDRVVLVKTYNGNNLSSEVRYTYDANNHNIEDSTIQYGEEKTKSKNVYVRDEHNNYTECKTYLDGDLVDIEYFDFEYYD